MPLHCSFRSLIIVFLPRWVRVNTLKLSLQSFLQNLSSKSFIEVGDLAALEETRNGYLIDLHVPDLLPFNRLYPVTTTFSREYSTGQIILQDKASCIPASLLDVQTGDIVLDACAAPGNKTTQLAAGVGTEGHVFAIERDEKRAVVLRDMVKKAGAEKCIPTEGISFLRSLFSTFARISVSRYLYLPQSFYFCVVALLLLTVM